MKNLIFILTLLITLTSCSKKDGEKNNTIDIANINTCEIITYEEINEILQLDNTIFTEDFDHIEITSAANKSCTFSFNKTATPTDWHSILIYLTPKVQGSISFEQSLNNLLNQGRNFNGNTVFPTEISNNEPIVLFWEYNYPYKTKEYQSHINNQLLVSVSYYVSENESFTAADDQKLKHIFDEVVERIKSN